MFSSSGYSHMPGVRMILCTVTIEVCIDTLDVIPLNARTHHFCTVTMEVCIDNRDVIPLKACTFQVSRVLASSDSRAPHFVLRPSDQRRDASAMAAPCTCRRARVT